MVDVVQEDLTDAGSPAGLAIAEILHPAVVGLEAGPATVVVLLGRRTGEEDEAGIEGRHGVGEEDLADDTVLQLVGVAALVVPVADAEVGVAEVLPRVLVLTPPGVELVAPLGIEVLAVLLVAPTGVAVRGDDRVRRVGSGCHGDTLPSFWNQSPVPVRAAPDAARRSEHVVLAAARIVTSPIDTPQGWSIAWTTSRATTSGVIAQ